jgi:hypothetical protein
MPHSHPFLENSYHGILFTQTSGLSNQCCTMAGVATTLARAPAAAQPEVAAGPAAPGAAGPLSNGSSRANTLAGRAAGGHGSFDDGRAAPVTRAMQGAQPPPGMQWLPARLGQALAPRRRCELWPE